MAALPQELRPDTVDYFAFNRFVESCKDEIERHQSGFNYCPMRAAKLNNLCLRKWSELSWQDKQSFYSEQEKKVKVMDDITTQDGLPGGRKKPNKRAPRGRQARTAVVKPREEDVASFHDVVKKGPQMDFIDKGEYNIEDDLVTAKISETDDAMAGAIAELNVDESKASESEKSETLAVVKTKAKGSKGLSKAKLSKKNLEKAKPDDIIDQHELEKPTIPQTMDAPKDVTMDKDDIKPNMKARAKKPAAASSRKCSDDADSKTDHADQLLKDQVRKPEKASRKGKRPLADPEEVLPMDEEMPKDNEKKELETKAAAKSSKRPATSRAKKTAAAKVLMESGPEVDLDPNGNVEKLDVKAVASKKVSRRGKKPSVDDVKDEEPLGSVEEPAVASRSSKTKTRNNAKVAAQEVDQGKNVVEEKRKPRARKQKT